MDAYVASLSEVHHRLAAKSNDLDVVIAKINRAQVPKSDFRSQLCALADVHSTQHPPHTRMHATTLFHPQLGDAAVGDSEVWPCSAEEMARVVLTPKDFPT